jgi:hypothetical protein
MPEVWGGVAGEVGLDPSTPARRVAAMHGMVIAPGASDVVEVRGRVLCYPRNADEATLRLAVIDWVTRRSSERPSARSYVDLIPVADPRRG